MSKWIPDPIFDILKWTKTEKTLVKQPYLTKMLCDNTVPLLFPVYEVVDLLEETVECNFKQGYRPIVLKQPQNTRASESKCCSLLQMDLNMLDDIIGTESRMSDVNFQQVISDDVTKILVTNPWGVDKDNTFKARNNVRNRLLDNPDDTTVSVNIPIDINMVVKNKVPDTSVLLGITKNAIDTILSDMDYKVGTINFVDIIWKPSASTDRGTYKIKTNISYDHVHETTSYDLISEVITRLQSRILTEIRVSANANGTQTYISILQRAPIFAKPSTMRKNAMISDRSVLIGCSIQLLQLEQLEHTTRLINDRCVEIFNRKQLLDDKHRHLMARLVKSTKVIDNFYNKQQERGDLDSYNEWKEKNRIYAEYMESQVDTYIILEKRIKEIRDMIEYDRPVEWVINDESDTPNNILSTKINDRKLLISTTKSVLNMNETDVPRVNRMTNNVFYFLHKNELEYSKFWSLYIRQDYD